MNECVTLVKKSCGHHGLIRSKVPQSTISCSQCALDQKDLDRVYVQILKKVFVDSTEVPDLGFDEMDAWIKERLRE